MKWFRYVPHALVSAYRANGWAMSNDMSGTHHGRHAVLMIWEGEGEPAH